MPSTERMPHIPVEDIEMANVVTAKGTKPQRPTTFLENVSLCGRVRAWRPSFTIVLLGLVILSIVLPVVVAVVLTTVGGNTVMRDQTRTANAVVSNGLSGIIEERLVIAERMAYGLDDLIQIGGVDYADQDAVFRSAATVLRTMRITTSLYFTDTHGKFYGAVRTGGGGVQMWKEFSNYTVCELNTDSELRLTGETEWCMDDYNATKSVWYNAVDRSNLNDSCWTALYASRDIYLSFSTVTAIGGSLVGVTGIDFFLGNIQQLVLDARVGNGMAIIVDAATGTFLGASDPKVKAAGVDAKTGKVIMYKVSDINNTLVKLVDAAVRNRYGSWKSAANETVWISDSVVVTIGQISRRGLKWLVVAIGTPKLATVDPVMLGVTLGIIAVILVLAVGFAIAITRPINNLSNDMASISKLKFDVSTKRNKLSVLKEIRNMQKSFLRLKTGTRALTRYISPSVVMDVMKSESGDVFVDMREERLTILFADLKGFTTLSEQLPHDVLISLLNLWLEEFGHVINRNSGYIDKFIGDCIMALFGAPVAIQDTEIAACNAALQFNDAIARVNAQAHLKGAPPLEFRVGIHTGEVLIGNLGYEDRVNYTVCGNPANIASRMEQLGKEYGVTPLISGDVYEKVKDKFACVLLDVVFLRGHKTIRTHVYHLMGYLNEATPADFLIMETYTRIHDNIRQGNATEATRIIDDVMAIPSFNNFRTALIVLQNHIKAGNTSQSSYISVDPSRPTAPQTVLVDDPKRPETVRSIRTLSAPRGSESDI